MAQNLGIIAVLTILLAFLIVCDSKKQPGIARKEDIPFIKCQVCQKISKQLYNQVQNKQSEISPKKISEYEIIEISENICDLKKKEADWILKIDIVEQGDGLELVEHDSEGQCTSKCKTIERACQEVMGYSDTDVAEYLYKKKPQIDSLVKFLCNDLTESCNTKPPPLPKGRTPGEPFVPKSEKEAEMEKIMKSMQGMPGAPGMKMYSREDLMNKNSFGDEDGEDDDDDDDDDETRFPSNLGKVLREKESRDNDWKAKVTKRVVDASEAVKKHANRVSHRVKKWWKSASFNKKSKTKTEL